MAALFVLRQRQTKRDPFVTLAKGFCNTLERERARAERLRQEIAAGRLTPETPVPAAEPAPAPTIDPACDPIVATEAAEAAAAMRPDRHVSRLDAALWRKATALRQKMLDEQLLHHAVAAHEQREMRSVPLDADQLDGAGELLASAPLAPDAVLSADDVQTLSEVRAMYRRLPRQRLQAICKAPPKGMERIFAVLAFENGLGGWPGGP
jgi:hypothetical protein